MAMYSEPWESMTIERVLRKMRHNVDAQNTRLKDEQTDINVKAIPCVDREKHVFGKRKWEGR